MPAMLHQRKSQLTDSKDSKLSDDHDMIHDHSLMQPKNNRRESFDEAGNPIVGGGSTPVKFNVMPAVQSGLPSDINATLGSKDKMISSV